MLCRIQIYQWHLARTRVTAQGVRLLQDLARLTFLDVRGMGMARPALQPLERKFALQTVQVRRRGSERQGARARGGCFVRWKETAGLLSTVMVACQTYVCTCRVGLEGHQGRVGNQAGRGGGPGRAGC